MNFQYTVLEECSKEKLNEREIYWIKFYDSFNNGYNETVGGDGVGAGVDSVRYGYKEPNSSSKYMGICRKTRDCVWTAQIVFDGHKVYIGSFANEIEAAKAYDYFALKLYGESAPINFTKEEAETFDIDKYIKKRTHVYTSSFIGIYWNKKISKWNCRIKVNNKTICIGYFENEVEAAFAYDSKVRELGLTNRKLNFP